MFTAEALMEALRATMFKSGFQRLRTAFDSSVISRKLTRDEAEKQIRETFGLGTDEPIPELTFSHEDGYSFDFHSEVAELLDQEGDVSKILIEAFLLALMAFWERHLNLVMNVEIYAHTAAMTWLKARGFHPDEVRLLELSLYANSLKHGSGRSCTQLHSLRPDLFKPGGIAVAGVYTPHPVDLVIDEAFLEGLFEAVHTSGTKT